MWNRNRSEYTKCINTTNNDDDNANIIISLSCMLSKISNKEYWVQIFKAGVEETKD